MPSLTKTFQNLRSPIIGLLAMSNISGVFAQEVARLPHASSTAQSVESHYRGNVNPIFGIFAYCYKTDDHRPEAPVYANIGFKVPMYSTFSPDSQALLRQQLFTVVSTASIFPAEKFKGQGAPHLSVRKTLTPMVKVLERYYGTMRIGLGTPVITQYCNGSPDSDLSTLPAWLNLE